MQAGGRQRPRGFTLIEIILVVGLLAVIAAMAIPAFVREIRQEELPASADQLRSVLWLVRAHAALDGRRFRVRFPMSDEKDSVEDERQPLIERETDPINAPEVFDRVTEPWATGTTFQGHVWCAEVRLGKPTAGDLQAQRSAIRDKLEETFEDIEPERPPLEIEVDGTSEWATFVLTEAPPGTEPDQLEDYATLEVILDGVTGLAWLQRPFFEEELDLFEEKGWPVVLGQDYTSPAVITEDRVLELRKFEVKP